MPDIPFTQYLRPTGRAVQTLIDRPIEIVTKALAIMQAGYRFESEVLSDETTVSLTIHDVRGEEDVAIELVPNGTGIPEAVDRLIEKFHARMRSAT